MESDFKCFHIVDLLRFDGHLHETHRDEGLLGEIGAVGGGGDGAGLEKDVVQASDAYDGAGRCRIDEFEAAAHEEEEMLYFGLSNIYLSIKLMFRTNNVYRLPHSQPATKHSTDSNQSL